MSTPPPLIDQHADIATPGTRFKPVSVHGVAWDLQHLKPFAFREMIKSGPTVDVVVFFSCHCFTHDFSDDPRRPVPAEEIYLDGADRRVLNEQRLRLSQTYLADFERYLRSKPCRVLGGAQMNYASFQTVDADGQQVEYGVFFTLKKDVARKRRIVLRVQSAYPVVPMTKKLREAGKVNLSVLLKAVYEGRTIKP